MAETRTIVTVIPKPRDWGKNDMCSVWGYFDDGSVWEVWTKLGDAATGHLTALKELLNKPSEVTTEDKGLDQRTGEQKYKLTAYPGMPQKQGGFGGGGGKFEVAFRNTEAGMRYDEFCMNRRTALMQAVAVVEPKSADKKEVITEYFRYFMGLLKEFEPPVSQTSKQPAVDATPAAGPKNRSKYEPDKDKGEPDQCEECHCPAGKYHTAECSFNDPFA